MELQWPELKYLWKVRPVSEEGQVPELTDLATCRYTFSCLMRSTLETKWPPHTHNTHTPIWERISREQKMHFGCPIEKPAANVSCCSFFHLFSSTIAPGLSGKTTNIQAKTVVSSQPLCLKGIVFFFSAVLIFFFFYLLSAYHFLGLQVARLFWELGFSACQKPFLLMLESSQVAPWSFKTDRSITQALTWERQIR